MQIYPYNTTSIVGPKRTLFPGKNIFGPSRPNSKSQKPSRD